MMKECPFNSRGKCDIWVDYQVTGGRGTMFFQLERNQLPAGQG